MQFATSFTSLPDGNQVDGLPPASSSGAPDFGDLELVSDGLGSGRWGAGTFRFWAIGICVIGIWDLGEWGLGDWGQGK